MFEAAGAVWNDEKRLWLLNELELTDEEMAAVFVAGRASGTDWTLFYGPTASPYAKVVARTNLMPSIGGSAAKVNLTRVCAGNKTIEIFTTVGIATNKIYGAFSLCVMLKKIKGPIDLSSITSGSDYNEAFYRCEKLESVQLKSVKFSISFSDSPLLTVEDSTDSTLGFLIENAANTAPITVTLHPDAYSRVPDSLKLKAQEKQISIVSV